MRTDTEALAVAEVSRATDFASLLARVSPERQDLFGDALAFIAEQRKRVTEMRDDILRPLREAEAATRRAFAPALATLDSAEALAKSRILAYREAVARRNAEAQAAAANAARAGDMAAAEAAARTLVPVAVAKGHHVRESWTYRVTDPALVPRAFLCVDDRAVREHAKRTPPEPIPGIVFERNERIWRNG